MGKMMTGFFFRALRSIEFWLLFILPCLYLYFFYTQNKDALLVSEGRICSDLRLLVTVMPLLLITLFVTVFFGRLFNDHTIRNLISSGASKKTTYFTSALFSLIATTLLDIVVITPIIIFLKVTKWENTLGWPTIICIILSSFLIHLVFSSVMLMVIFFTGKQILTIVCGTLIFAAVVGGAGVAPVYALLQPERDPQVALISKYRDLNPDKDITMELDIDIKTMEDKIIIYEDGVPIDTDRFTRPNPNYVSGTKRQVLRAIALYNPAPSLVMEMVYPPKTLYEKGVYNIFFEAGSAWLMIFVISGTVLFNRKEIS